MLLAICRPSGCTQWRIYHWATWAMPPFELPKNSHMAKNATGEVAPIL